MRLVDHAIKHDRRLLTHVQLALAVTLVRREYLAEKKMKDQGYID